MIVTSSEQAEKLLLAIQTLKMQYPSFIMITAKRILNEEIIDAIHRDMAKAGISKKVIERVYLSEPEFLRSKIKFNIISDYKSEDGFDVAFAIENGTQDHIILPKEKKTLSWIENGKRFFSKGHKVSGIPKRDIIKSTVEKKLPTAINRINDEILSWRQKTIFRS